MGVSDAVESDDLIDSQRFDGFLANWQLNAVQCGDAFLLAGDQVDHSTLLKIDTQTGEIRSSLSVFLFNVNKESASINRSSA